MSMTEQDRRIAGPAIEQRKSQNYGFLDQEVAKLTGICVTEVKKTLDRLTGEFIVKRCGGLSPNRPETPTGMREVALAWYDRGDAWPK
jgi:hypothetical protein